jgi:hypothetical protein
MEVIGQFHAPVALPRGETDLGTKWIGGRVDRRVCPNTVECRKVSAHVRNQIAAVQPVARRYINPGSVLYAQGKIITISFIICSTHEKMGSTILRTAKNEGTTPETKSIKQLDFI